MTPKRVKPKKDATRAPAIGTWQFIDVSELRSGKNEELRKVVRSNAMRDYRQKYKAMRSKAKMLLEAEDPSSTTRRSSSDSSPAPTTADSDGASLSADNLAQMLLRGEGKPGDEVFYWPSEWESTLQEVKSLTISPPPAPGEKAALKRQPQKGVVSADLRLRSKSFPVDLSLSSNASPGNGAGDPFDALPSSAPDASELIHHFNFIFRSKTAPGPNGEPSPMSTVWMPLTFTDPLLFQTSINLAATHRDSLSSHQNQRKSLVRKTQTIDMVNARLSCPRAAVSDESIGAVCLLAASERTAGNLDELRLHMAALPRMVDLRGGSEYFRKSREMLHMFVIWEDMLSSVTLSSPPQFPHPPCCSMIRIPLLYPNMHKPEFPPSPHITPLLSVFPSITALATLVLHPLLHQDVENLSSQLLSLNDATNPNIFSNPRAHGTFSASDLDRFHKERADIDHRLQTMRKLSDIPLEERRLSDYSHEAARLGCRIYTHTILSRNLPQPLSLLMSLASDSIALITAAHRHGVLNLHRKCPPPPFIWLLCLGGVLPLTEEQEEWFAQRIVDVVAHCGMFREFSAGDIQSRGMCWMVGLGTSPVRSLWRRVEGLWEG